MGLRSKVEADQPSLSVAAVQETVRQDRHDPTFPGLNLSPGEFLKAAAVRLGDDEFPFLGKHDAFPIGDQQRTASDARFFP
jgi:hypothetical protein